MTETSILPGASPAVDSGVGAVPPQGSDHDESEGSGNRRNLMIIAAVAGVVVLAIAAYFLLFNSSSSSPSGPVQRGVFHGTPATTGSAGTSGGHTTTSATKGGKSAGKAVSLPKVVKNPKVRDPFKPLITAPVTGGTSAGTTNVTAPTGTSSTPPVTTTPVTSPTTPAVTTPVVTTPTSGKTTTTGSGKTVGMPLYIQLVKVHGRVASFKVGYAHHKFRKYNVQAPKATSSSGTLFDKEFALIGIQSGEVTVQIGDATPFDLTTGIAHVV